MRCRSSSGWRRPADHLFVSSCGSSQFGQGVLGPDVSIRHAALEGRARSHAGTLRWKDGHGFEALLCSRLLRRSATEPSAVPRLLRSYQRLEREVPGHARSAPSSSKAAARSATATAAGGGAGSRGGRISVCPTTQAHPPRTARFAELPAGRFAAPAAGRAIQAGSMPCRLISARSSPAVGGFSRDHMASSSAK